MKQETRELLDYIISAFDERRAISLYTTERQEADIKIFNEKQQKIQDFLRSIPEIEKHLTEGGYIQDRNGTPICHGDKIKLCNPYFYEGSPYEAYRYAVLNWNPRVAKFEVIYEINDQSVATSDLSIFPPQQLEKA